MAGPSGRGVRRKQDHHGSGSRPAEAHNGCQLRGCLSSSGRSGEPEIEPGHSSSSSFASYALRHGPVPGPAPAWVRWQRTGPESTFEPSFSRARCERDDEPAEVEHARLGKDEPELSRARPALCGLHDPRVARRHRARARTRRRGLKNRGRADSVGTNRSWCTCAANSSVRVGSASCHSTCRAHAEQRRQRVVHDLRRTASTSAPHVRTHARPCVHHEAGACGAAHVLCDEDALDERLPCAGAARRRRHLVLTGAARANAGDPSASGPRSLTSPGVTATACTSSALITHTHVSETSCTSSAPYRGLSQRLLV
jgi:hypothetical protein